MSPDPSGSSAQAKYEPQRWNRYAYSLNNPIKYLDPDGRDVEIATNARSAFRYAYTHSKTFRQQFHMANGNREITIKFELDKVIGARAEWRPGWGTEPVEYQHSDGTTTGSWKVWGTIALSALGDADTGALMGHELKHANNMAEHGKRGEGPGEEGDRQSEAVERSIQIDYRNDQDDQCGGSADQALMGGQGQTSQFRSFEGFAHGLGAWMAAGEAEWRSRHPNERKVTGK
jgi:hypothetical protein